MATILQKAQEILAEKQSKLLAENIREDLTILGVTGEMQQKIDTSDATAKSPDIVLTKTAYVNDEKIIGTLVLVEEGDSTTSVYDAVQADESTKQVKVTSSFESDVAFRAGSNTTVGVAYNDIALAAGLTADKLVDGQTVLGVKGTTLPLSASLDASATKDDIAYGETAYVSGVKITGTLPTYTGNIEFTSPVLTKIDSSTLKVSAPNSKDKLLRDGATVITRITESQVANAIELTSDKIITGQTVLGVAGTGKTGIDTDKANATPSDIAEGVTAVVNDVLITGTVATKGASTSTTISPSVSISNDNGIYKMTLTERFTTDTLFRPNATITTTQNLNNQATNLGITPEKVVLGSTILGVAGTGLGINTSDATATSDKIFEGYTAYVNNTKITGTYKYLDTYLANARAQDLALGKTAFVDGQMITGTLTELSSGSHYITAETEVSTDSDNVIFTAGNTVDRVIRKDVDVMISAANADVAAAIGLVPAKIIEGQTILGIEGTGSGGGVDTFDATATPGDILEGITAYVAGEKVTGTATKVTALDSGVKQVIDDGAGTIYFTAATVTPGFYIDGASIKLNMSTATLAAQLGITADKIKAGEVILGITGTHTGYDPEDNTSTAITYPTYDDMVADTEQVEGTVGIVGDEAYKYTTGTWVPASTYNDASAAYETLSTIGLEEAATEYEGMGGTEEEIQDTFDEILGTTEQ